jgi:hypothetical protein
MSGAEPALRRQALAEMRFCEIILAKTGDSVVTRTIGAAASIEPFAHFPPGDAQDPATGAVWYYHAHEPGPVEDGCAEHGHFHCFLRPDEGQGDIHHLVAIGVDAHGRPLRLFTVNGWVTGDTPATAETQIALLGRFDPHSARPCYLVHRWLAALLRAHRPAIEQLIRQREKVLVRHAKKHPDPLNDRGLEVTSEKRLTPS